MQNLRVRGKKLVDVQNMMIPGNRFTYSSILSKDRICTYEFIEITDCRWLSGCSPSCLGKIKYRDEFDAIHSGCFGITTNRDNFMKCLIIDIELIDWGIKDEDFLI